MSGINEGCECLGAQVLLYSEGESTGIAFTACIYDLYIFLTRAVKTSLSLGEVCQFFKLASVQILLL